jgi:hypothetical protein
MHNDTHPVAAPAPPASPHTPHRYQWLRLSLGAGLSVVQKPAPARPHTVSRPLEGKSPGSAKRPISILWLAAITWLYRQGEASVW